MITKISAIGTNAFAKTLRQCGTGALTAAVLTGLRSSQGRMNRICRKRTAAMIATKEKNSPQRVSSNSVACMLCTVVNATIGRNSAAARAAVTAASFSARMTWAWRAGASAAISHLFDVGLAEQALRQEDQRDRKQG